MNERFCFILYKYKCVVFQKDNSQLFIVYVSINGALTTTTIDYKWNSFLQQPHFNYQNWEYRKFLKKKKMSQNKPQLSYILLPLANVIHFLLPFLFWGIAYKHHIKSKWNTPKTHVLNRKYTNNNICKYIRSFISVYYVCVCVLYIILQVFSCLGHNWQLLIIFYARDPLRIYTKHVVE